MASMAPYLGLRGSSLSRAIIALVVGPAFVTYGYNLSVAGGLLTLESFVETFPQLDTLHTNGEQQHYNAAIQGAPPVSSPPFVRSPPLARNAPDRDRRG